MHFLNCLKKINYETALDFLVKIGSKTKAKTPRKTVIMSCEVQTIQPKALPATSGILYKNKILAIKTGKNPNPPLVKAIVKLPMIKATKTAPKLIELVSSSA